MVEPQVVGSRWEASREGRRGDAFWPSRSEGSEGQRRRSARMDRVGAPLVTRLIVVENYAHARQRSALEADPVLSSRTIVERLLQLQLRGAVGAAAPRTRAVDELIAPGRHPRPKLSGAVTRHGEDVHLARLRLFNHMKGNIGSARSRAEGKEVDMGLGQRGGRRTPGNESRSSARTVRIGGGATKTMAADKEAAFWR